MSYELNVRVYSANLFPLEVDLSFANETDEKMLYANTATDLFFPPVSIVLVNFYKTI